MARVEIVEFTKISLLWHIGLRLITIPAVYPRSAINIFSKLKRVEN